MAITRRSLLRRSALIAPLPFLRSFEAAAAVDQEPLRFIFWKHPHGVIKSAWAAAGKDETDFQLGRILQPLAPFRSRILLVDGLTNEAGRNTGEPHPVVNLLTGVGGSRGEHGGISLDQLIAQDLVKRGQRTRFASLVLGVQPGRGTARVSLSASGPRAGIAPESQPDRVFARVFAGVTPSTPDDPTAGRRLAERRSILDLVRTDLEALKGRLGSEPARHLEHHLTAVRAIEGRLASGTPLCTPGRAADPSPSPDGSYGAEGRLQTDLTVTAMACDLTRVATINFGSFVDERPFPWLGIDDRHHIMSHSGADLCWITRSSSGGPRYRRGTTTGARTCRS